MEKRFSICLIHCVSWERWVDWLEEAEDDLAAARDLYGTGRYAKACFLAQQAAEKALKALLMKRVGIYEGTHSVVSLLERAGTSVGVPHEVLAAGDCSTGIMSPPGIPMPGPRAPPAGASGR